MYSVYILKSVKNSKYYIGFTSDLEKRFKKHNSGGNTSTKSGIPWVMIYSESFESKKDAWLREREIKSFKSGTAFKKLIGLVD